jgi:biopolymer transport protein ExbD
MIDVIFQIFIFFVCTVDLQSQTIDIGIEFPKAPHGKPVSGEIPGTVHIVVYANGGVAVGKEAMSFATLQNVLLRYRADYGEGIPVVIQGDKGATHAPVKSVLDACSKAGIKNIMFAAIKEKKGG